MLTQDKLLLSIRTLCPRRESPFGGKAEQIATKFAKKYGIYSHNFQDFNTMSRFAYPSSVSAERLAAAAIVHNNFFFLDDLLFDKVLFSEGYKLCLMSNNKLEKEHSIEFKCTDKAFEYRVIGLDDKEKMGIILWEDLPDIFPRNDKEILAKESEFLPEILKHTSKAGHTTLELYGIPKNIGTNPIAFLEELLETFVSNEVPPHASKIHYAFADIGQQLISFTSKSWIILFTTAIKNYLMAAKSLNEKHFKGTLKEFIAIRDEDTGGLQTCMLLEVTNDVVLPDNARENKILFEMTNLTYRSAALVNDVISYHKDVILEGSDFNLIYQIMKDGHDFKSAVQESVLIINNLIQKFLDLEQKLPTWDNKTNDIVKRYVSGLKELMSGNTYWHLSSPRYHHPNSPFSLLR